VSNNENHTAKDEGQQQPKRQAVAELFCRTWAAIVAALAYLGKTLVSLLKIVFPSDDTLLWIAGVDAAWFKNDDEENKNTEERLRFEAQGAIICLTSIFATMGALYFFSVAFEGTLDILGIPILVYVILISLVWGAMIFSIDRYMLMTMLGERGNLFWPSTLRIMLAIIIGIIIAHPLKLQIFQSDLASLYSEERAAHFRERAAQSATARDQAYQKVYSIPGRTRDEIDLYFAIRSARQTVHKRQTDYNEAAYREDNQDSSDSAGQMFLSLPLLPAVQPTVILTQIKGGCDDPWSENKQLIAHDAEYRELETLSGKQHFILHPVREADLAELRERVSTLLGEIRSDLKSAKTQSKGERTITNCHLFRYLEEKWGQAATYLADEESALYLTNAEKTRLEDNADALVEARLEAKIDSSCSSALRNYTLEQQRSQEKLARTMDIDLAEERSKAFGSAETLDFSTTIEEQNSWLPLICTSLFNSFSFLKQTELLYTLSHPSSEITKPPINPWVALVASWSLTIIFAFMECVPVLSKLISRPGPYELDVARRKAMANQSAQQTAAPNQEELAKAEIQKSDWTLREKLRVQSSEAAIAFRARVLNEKAQVLFSEISSDEKKKKIEELDEFLSNFIKNLDGSVRDILNGKETNSKELI
jgi:hypothetical protein